MLRELQFLVQRERIKNNFKQKDRINIESNLSEKHLFSRKNQPYFTAASALIEWAECIFTDERGLVTLTHLADLGELENIPLSLLVLLGKKGVIKVTEIVFSDSEKKNCLK